MTSKELSDAANNNGFYKLSRVQLEEALKIVHSPQGPTHFSAPQLVQVGETIRLLLLREHIDTLQLHITKLNASNKIIQCWVIALAVAALISTVIQTAVAIRGELRAATQTQPSAQVQQQSQTPITIPTTVASPAPGQPTKKTP